MVSIKQVTHLIVYSQKIRLIVTIDDDVKALREKMIAEQQKLNEVYL